MDDDIISLLKNGRARKNLTQQQVADALKVSRAAVGQWESGATQPSFANFIRLKMLLTPEEVNTKPATKEDEEAIKRVEKLIMQPNLRKSLPGFDVPVMMMVGSEFGLAAEFNKPLFYVRRPDGVIDNQNIFAIQIYGNSMFPRYDNEEICFVASNAEIEAGKYFIIEYHIRGMANVPAAPYLRRVVSVIGERIEVEQFNPPERDVIEAGDYRIVGRLLHWSELFPVRPPDTVEERRARHGKLNLPD